VFLALAAPAAAQDGFRNVLAAGQGETANAVELGQALATNQAPPSFTSQLPLYEGLLYGAPSLTEADLDRYFKSAAMGPPSDIASTDTPRPGVRILRDRAHGVPRVYGATRSDTMFGAGYASAQDRLFLMDLLRRLGRGRLSEFAGEDFLELDAEQLRVADYTEAELHELIENGVRAAGADGPLLRRDLDDYTAGVNKYIAEARLDPSKMPGEYAGLGKTVEDWKPTDTAAAATLIAAMFGRGGGRESRVAEVLSAAKARFGRRRGRRVFRDLRRIEDPEAPVTTPRRFPFDRPGRPSRRAVAVPDPGSLRETGAFVPPAAATARARSLLHRLGLGFHREQSHALLVGARGSRSGRPLAVMGPQFGYYSPEVLLEIELHGPGIDVRGVAYPGASFFVIMGRGRDFAWSATTASADDTDEFVERLCDEDHYLYKGRCEPFVERDHVLRLGPSPADPSAPARTVTFHLERSVHGPIQSHATVRGRPVAIAVNRASYLHDLDSAVAFKRLNANEVSSARDFQRVMGATNLTYSWFYVDDRSIAFALGGWYPRRAKGADPSLPAWGTGEFDWRGRLPQRRLPRDADPRRGYIVDWNNKLAPGWRAQDDRFSLGPIYRSEMPQKSIRAALRRGGRLDLVGLVKIMQDAATADLRGREIYPWIRRLIRRVRDPDARALVGLLDAWRRGGAHRRDLDRDGTYDDVAAVALMDAWWPRLVRGVFEPVLGHELVERARAITGFGSPPPTSGSAFGSGWWGHLDKDLRALLGRRVRGRLSRRYCGRGSRARCRGILVSTLKEAAAELRGRYGADPSTWRASDRIEFFTAGGVATPSMPWQNRGTFQQVVEVGGP
jgi:acyl-homoserine lactone acylase PvdQ